MFHAELIKHTFKPKKWDKRIEKRKHALFQICVELNRGASFTITGLSTSKISNGSYPGEESQKLVSGHFQRL